MIACAGVNQSAFQLVHWSPYGELPQPVVTPSPADAAGHAVSR